MEDGVTLRVCLNDDGSLLTVTREGSVLDESGTLFLVGITFLGPTVVLLLDMVFRV